MEVNSYFGPSNSKIELQLKNMFKMLNGGILQVC